MEKELDLFEKAKESKVLLNVGFSTMILFFILFIGQIIGSVWLTIIGIILKGPEHVMENIEELSYGPIGLILTFIFSLAICLLWVKFVEKRKISSIGLKREGAFAKFIKGFVIGLLLFTSVTFLMYIFGIITLEQGFKIGLKSLPGILIIIPGWIVQSSTEEIITRGWYMNVVGAKHTPAIGFIASSIIFGVMHLANPGVGFISILNIVLVGFMFGLYVIYSQDLWGACAMHAAWNFAQGNIFGFTVSGLNAEHNTLLKFSSQGHEIFTGGQFGPEASIFTTLVSLVFIVIIIIKLKNKKMDLVSKTY